MYQPVRLNSGRMEPTTARRVRSDGVATRARILDAATREFAERGIAGARVDRIARSARANKSQLYSHFRSKEALFDAVLRTNVEALVDTAPLDAEDLPAYAVSLYDAYLAQPDMVRLATWHRLERREARGLLGGAEDTDATKLRAIADAQAGGLVVADLDPADIHSMVIAMSMTWSAVSVTQVAGPEDPPRLHDRRRAALAQAVRKAFVVAA